MSDQRKDREPFIWREIVFRWYDQRAAHMGSIFVGDQQFWFFVQEPAHFQAWVEWGSGYTRPCTMPERIDALEGARVQLLNVARTRHEQLQKRFQ